jgi:hypothetical protein
VASHVTPQGTHVQASAYVLNEIEHATIVWLHNDGFGLQTQLDLPNPSEVEEMSHVGHWEGFGPANDSVGPERASRWGYDIPHLVETNMPHAGSAQPAALIMHFVGKFDRF